MICQKEEDMADVEAAIRKVLLRKESLSNSSSGVNALSIILLQEVVLGFSYEVH